MKIRCGTFAADYSKAEVDAMCAQMAEFQKGISLQKSAERFMAGQRPRATGIGVGVIHVPTARTFNLKEPQPGPDGVVWVRWQEAQAMLERMQAAS